jgi:lysyl-tRNA synthetase class I
MQDDSLSRRKKVQLEDAKVALELSAIDEQGRSLATSVSFRHLALLAQIKPNDNEVWASLQASGTIEQPSRQLQDRLTRMRSWIASGHFPEEMKVDLCTEPDFAALALLNDDQRRVIDALTRALGSAEWTAEGITAAFKRAGQEAETGMRDVYRASYALFMGAERGPRLAPILSNCNQEEILDLVRKASNSPS